MINNQITSMTSKFVDNELLDLAEAYKFELDQMSDNIRALEKFLEEHCSGMFFELNKEVKDECGVKVKYHFKIIWNYLTHTDKFRLMAGKTFPDNTITAFKPIIEHKIDWRVEASNYLPEFMDAVKTKLKQLIKE